jgi:hypothetical protein
VIGDYITLHPLDKGIKGMTPEGKDANLVFDPETADSTV